MPAAGAAHGRDENTRQNHRGHGPLLRVACVLLAALLLYALAWQLTRQGIDRQARAKLALFESGQTPWDFVPHAVEDLIAGRAFGDAKVSHDRRGLVVRSINGKAYTLGVPLPYPVDLHRFPVVRLALDVEAPTQLRWVLRRGLDRPLLTSGAMLLQPGTHDIQVDLRDLDWSRRRHGKAVPMPPVAAMLRLKLQHAPDSIVRLQGLDWKRAKQGQRQEVAGANRHGIPVFQLGLAGVEDMLAQREVMRYSSPATVVTSTTDALRSQATDRHDAMQTILALLAYGLFLLWVVLNTRRNNSKPAVRRVLPAVQVAVAAGPMLTFAVGMYGNPGPGPVWIVAMSAGMAIALWLAWRDYGTRWRWLTWNGRMAWRDWTMPALTTVAAAGLLLAYTAEPHLPSPRRIIAYGLWAGLQQLLILAALAPRLRSYCPPRWLCALALAAVFALAHAPNAMLMELTLLAELLWAWQFLRRPVLLPIILAHAATGLLLAMGIAELPLRSLEIGARFLQ